MVYEYINMINRSTKQGIQVIYITKGKHKKIHTITNNLNLIHYISNKATKYTTLMLSTYEYSKRIEEANRKGYTVI